MRKPHTKLSTRVRTVPLGRVFSDAPSNPSDGYFGTLLDETTTWAATRALEHKSATEVFAFVSDTIAMLERQTGHKLKRFASDGGKEYDDDMFRSWFLSTGAIWEYIDEQGFATTRWSW